MKKKNLLMTAIAIFGFLAVTFGQIPNYVPLAGLEVYYGFNGNANEEINALNGVVSGAVLTTDANGNPNSAYSFNGLSDYIAIPHEFLGGDDNVPISSYYVRFKVNSIDPLNQQGIWNKDGFWRENRIRISPDSSISLSWYYPQIGHGFGTNPGVILPGIWYDVVFVNSASPMIYVNGVAVQTNTSTTGSNFNPTVSFSHSGQGCVGGGIECNRFGLVRWSGAPTRYLNGSIDEFGIWDRALTDCEIQALYSGQITSPSSGIDVVSTCTSYQWIDGNTYTQSTNTPTFILTNAQGCDSTVTLDLTISQAPQPTIACYETATFDTTTCQWDVSGTQPTQPTIACYETATFNDTTCQWDVSGTQPTQPTTACYETATFNTTTCQWDVSGTQPTISQPTNQTININTNAQFATGSSDPNATFQWQTDLGVGFQNLNTVGQYSGANTNTLTVSNVTMSNNNQPFRCIISSGLCSDTSNVAVLNVNSSVGINETIQENLFSIFPNPVQNVMNITADTKLVGNAYSIYDNTGKVLLTGILNSENKTIELSNLSDGIYFFSLGENMNQSFKILKK